MPREEGLFPSQRVKVEGGPLSWAHPEGHCWWPLLLEGGNWGQAGSFSLNPGPNLRFSLFSAGV